RMLWVQGDESGPTGRGEGGRVASATRHWLDRWVRGDRRVRTGAAFEWSRWWSHSAGAAATYPTGVSRSLLLSAPGRLVDRPEDVRVGALPLANPPGGQPAAVTDVPGLGARLPLELLRPIDFPGQHADFTSEPLPAALEVVGAPALHVRVESSTGEAVLFAKLYD